MLKCDLVDIVLSVLCGFSSVLAVVGVCAGYHWSDNDNVLRDGIWTEDTHYNKREYQTVRAFTMMGTLMAIGSFILSVLRLRVSKVIQSKSCRVLFMSLLSCSFLCLLVSLAVWGDLIAHRKRQRARLDKRFRIFGKNIKFGVGISSINIKSSSSNSRGVSISDINAVNLGGTDNDGNIIITGYNVGNNRATAKLSGDLILGWGFWVTVAADVALFLSNLLHLMGQDCRSQPDSQLNHHHHHHNHYHHRHHHGAANGDLSTTDGLTGLEELSLVTGSGSHGGPITN